MRKKLRLLLSFAATFVCCFAAAIVCACSANAAAPELRLLEYAFLPDVYINREFDALTVLESTDDGVNYGLSDVFYLDGSLEQVDIPFDGTKFTQTKPYDVFLTIYAEKKGKKTEEELTLKLVIESNEIQSALISSWNSSGIVKVMTADPEYLDGNAESSVKVSYNGSYNPLGEGNNIGDLPNAKGYSKTSWDNAVVTMRVYNAAEYDLELGAMILKNGQLFNGLPYLYLPQTLVSKQWVTLRWSLKTIGITYDLFEQGMSISFKVRIPDTTGLVSPYNYTFIISGLDIADYSEEKFPGLETRTDKEIFDSLPGDPIDKCLVSYYTATEYAGDGYPYCYFYTTLKAEIDETVYDETLENSRSSVKYTVNPSQTGKSQYFSAPICLSKLGEQGKLNDYVTYENLAKSVLTFRVKNVSKQEMSLKWIYEHGNNLSILHPFEGEEKIPNDGEWHTVEIRINAKGAEKLTSANGQLNICSRFAKAEENATFYVDGLNIVPYTGPEFPETEEGKITETLYENMPISGYDSFPYRYHYGVLTSSVVSDVTKDSDLAMKYVMKEYAAGKSQYAAVPFALKKADLEEIAKLNGCNTFENAYIGFWVKNDFSKDLDIRFYCKNGSDTDVTQTPLWVKTVSAGGEWQYVEIAVENVLEMLNKGAPLSIVARYATNSLADGATFYIDGFKVSADSSSLFPPNAAGKTEELLIGKTAESGYNAYPYRYHFGVLSTAVSKTEAHGEGVSIKYTMTPAEGFSPSQFGAAAMKLTKADLAKIAEYSGCADLSTATIGFWVKNEFGKALDIRLYCQGDIDITNAAMSVTTIENDGEWHYVEIGISADMMTKLDRGISFSVVARYVANRTEMEAGATFYIDDFTIFTKQDD